MFRPRSLMVLSPSSLLLLACPGGDDPVPAAQPAAVIEAEEAEEAEPLEVPVDSDAEQPPVDAKGGA